MHWSCESSDLSDLSVLQIRKDKGRKCNLNILRQLQKCSNSMTVGHGLDLPRFRTFLRLAQPYLPISIRCKMPALAEIRNRSQSRPPPQPHLSTSSATPSFTIDSRAQFAKMTKERTEKSGLILGLNRGHVRTLLILRL